MFANVCTEPKQNAFSTLPDEMISTIFEELPDIRCLTSAIHVCHKWYDVYKASNGKISRRLFTRRYANIRNHRLGEAYWDLDHIIKEPWLNKLYVKQIFETAWPIFLDQQLEELLYPLGMAFARGCGEIGEKVLLQMVWDSKSSPPPQELPEDSSRWQPSLIPVGQRLLQLTKNKSERKTIAADIKRLSQLKGYLKQRSVRVENRNIFLHFCGEESIWPTFTLFNAPRLRLAKDLWPRERIANIITGRLKGIQDASNAQNYRKRVASSLRWKGKG